jgi:hypothetical protein
MNESGKLNNERPRFGTGRSAYLLYLVGALGILLFVRQVARTYWSVYSDLDQLFVAGVAWRKGLSPYDGHLLPYFGVPDGPTNEMLHTYYYAPLSAMLFAPLTLLSYPTFIAVWKFSVFGLLLTACWRFLRLACPEIPASVSFALVGMTAMSGSLRWNLVQFQPTALIVAALIWFVCAVLEDRFWLAVALGVFISIKMTYFLPVVGLLLFRHQYKQLACMVILIGGLNALSLAQTGPFRTLETYRNAMRTFEDPGKMTRPDALDTLTPFLKAYPQSPLAQYAPKDREPGHWAGEQLHLRFILSAFGIGYEVAKILGGIFTLGVLLFFGVLWRRARATGALQDAGSQAVLFAAMMSSSVLVVYHQRYDAIALLPCAFVATAALYRRRTDLLAWTTLISTLALSYVFAARMLNWWYVELAVQRGWLIAVPLCGYVAVIVWAGSLGLVWRQVTAVENPLLVDTART